MKVSFLRSLHFMIVFLLCLNINYPSQAQDQPPGGQVDLPPNLETAIRGLAEAQNISIKIISVQKSNTQSFDEYCVIMEPALHHAGLRVTSNYWVLADQGFIITHVPSNEEGFRAIGCNPGSLQSSEISGIEPLAHANIGQVISLVTGQGPAVANSVDWSPDGQMLVIAYGNSGVIVYEITDLTFPYLVLDSDVGYFDALYSPTGLVLATLGADRIVRLWDAQTGTRIAILDNFPGPVANSIAFLPESSILAIGDSAGLVHFWDTASETLIRTIHASFEGSPVSALAFDKTGQVIMIGGENGAVELLEIQSETQVGFSGGSLRVISIAVHPEDKYIAFVPDGQGIGVWDIPFNLTPSFFFPETIFGVRSISFSPDGSLIALGGYGGVGLWEITNTKPLTMLLEGMSGITDLAFNPNGTRLATTDVSGKITLWGIRSETETSSQPELTIEVTNPDQCPDLPMRLMFGEMGRTVINGSGPSNVRPFPGSPDPLFQIQEGQVFRVVQSPAGSQYVSPYCLLAGDGTPNRWWLIDVEGLGQGWVIETWQGDYNLEPWIQPDVVVPVDNSLTAPLIGTWVYYVETGMSELPEILHSSITFENNGMFSSVEQRICGWYGNYQVIAIDTIRFDARGACEGGDEVSSVYDLKFSLSNDKLTIVSADGSPIVYEREDANTEIVEEGLSQPELTIVSETPIFQSPSINSPVVGTAAIGTIYEVVGKNANSLWAQIRFNGQEGWVCREGTEDNGLLFLVMIANSSEDDCEGDTYNGVDVSRYDFEQAVEYGSSAQPAQPLVPRLADGLVLGQRATGTQTQVIFVNGIQNTSDDFRASLSLVQLAFDDRAVLGIYNATAVDLPVLKLAGFRLDTLQSMNDMLEASWGFRLDFGNPAVRTLITELQSSSGRVEIVAHSQGSIITAAAIYLLLEQGYDLSNVNIYTLGTPLPRFPQFGNEPKYYHCIYDRDWVAIATHFNLNGEIRRLTSPDQRFPLIGDVFEHSLASYINDLNLGNCPRLD